ncbi:helix-turn-helix transcriptional regulator [Streptomyces sp. NBC_01190]|uniref:helix-turn-helix transcriptional regulator n=1 Tax=Streptomyces sp. NBC_01190 TaxID=2903767 RepID=UPI00386BBE34|nr:helix-turn-helix transcriptional regulator [Streptomyces sp. NBC_01190]
MTAHDTSSGSGGHENANAPSAIADRRHRPPAVGRPGARVGPPYAADRPRAPQALAVPAVATLLTGDAPLGAWAWTGTAAPTAPQPVALGPVRLSLLDTPAPPAAVEIKAEIKAAGAGRPAGSHSPTWHLVFASDGPLLLGRGRPRVRLKPGSLILWEPSARLWLRADTAGSPVRALVLHVPGAALPLPAEVLRAMSGRPAPTGSGPAALLAALLHGLAAHAPSAEARHTAWLGSAAVNLLTAFLADETALPRTALPHVEREVGAQGEAEVEGAVKLEGAADAASVPAPYPAPSGTDLLLRDIKAYIEHHLPDPGLSPTRIAAASHISLRYLHHLFQRDGRTVGAFLRERRLEHCRADLADPAQTRRSACEIARRWGFGDPAVFNRTFKSAYGVTPGTYRGQRPRG